MPAIAGGGGCERVAGFAHVEVFTNVVGADARPEREREIGERGDDQRADPNRGAPVTADEHRADRDRDEDTYRDHALHAFEDDEPG